MKDIFPYDERRDLYIGETTEEAIAFAVEHWIHTAQRAIQRKGRFVVALSGGSTPKAIYAALSSTKQTAIDWTQVWLFWSDERSCPPDHLDSNYGMAISFFKTLPIPPSQIFRMQAERESEIEKKAFEYEEIIHKVVGKSGFDLVMLGMGEDGHIASLFPNTAALMTTDRVVVSNFIPQKKTYRMTLTFRGINQSGAIALYVLGKSKARQLDEILKAPIISAWPASQVGTLEHKALLVLDKDSASVIQNMK